MRLLGQRPQRLDGLRVQLVAVVRHTGEVAQPLGAARAAAKRRGRHETVREMQAVAERLLALQSRQHERQAEELRGLLHMQSTTQIREITALHTRQAAEMSRLGLEIMDRIAAQVTRDGGPHLDESEALEGQLGVFESHVNQPEVQEQQAARTASAGVSASAEGSPTEQDDPSVSISDQEQEMEHSGCGDPADVRAILDGDVEDGGRTAGGAAVSGAEPPHAHDVHGASGCNRDSLGRVECGVSDGSDVAVHGDGGLGVQRDPAPTPLPASSSGEELSRQQDESDTLQVAGAPRRGREDDADTARGEGAIRQCDDGSTTGEHNEYEFTYWFNLYQAIEDEAKCNGVQAALLYACDVTGWHRSALTVRTGSSGVHSCSAKLYSGEHTLDSVRGREGLSQEAPAQYRGRALERHPPVCHRSHGGDRAPGCRFRRPSGRAGSCLARYAGGGTY